MTPEEIKSLRGKFFKECTYVSKNDAGFFQQFKLPPQDVFEWFIKAIQERNSDVASEIVLENLDNGNAETYVPNVPSPDVKSVASHSCAVSNSIDHLRQLVELEIKQIDSLGRYSHTMSAKSTKAAYEKVLRFIDQTNIQNKKINVL